MFLRAQVSDLSWQPWQHASKVQFSVPPTPATQTANLQLVLAQDTFDTFGFQLGDVYDVTFLKVHDAYVPQGDDVIVTVERHERSVWDRTVWGKDVDGKPVATGTEQARSSMLRARHVDGGACKWGMFNVQVDTSHVEYGHDEGSRFRLTFKCVERRATAHATAEAHA